MDLMTISQVARDFNISTRTLRYYESIGLLQSCKKEDYAYRTYNIDALRRLQQIIVLRKLRIPLKQIKLMVHSKELVHIIEVFQDKVAELDLEIDALTAIRTILQTFVSQLQDRAQVNAKIDLLQDSEMIELIESLSLSKIKLKEETSMDELKEMSGKLNKLQDRDVRIVHVSPYTVAAAHYIGEDPERHCGNILQQFILDSGLYGIKKDARVFGFNHPNPSEGNPYGYEIWVTIPDDMEVPSPLSKKHFKGGLYAAHKITMGDFHEWQWLCDWVINSSKFDDNSDHDGGECMHGLLEEHLNHLYWMHQNWPEDAPSELDLLFPIKPKAGFK